VSKDPLVGKVDGGQTLNRYVYALNNPVRLIDTSGFSTQEGAKGTINTGSSDMDSGFIVDVGLGYLESVVRNVRDELWSDAITNYLRSNAFSFGVNNVTFLADYGLPLAGLTVSGVTEYAQSSKSDMYWMEKASRVAFNVAASAAGSLVTLSTGSMVAGAVASSSFNTFGYAAVEAAGEVGGDFIYDKLGIYNPDYNPVKDTYNNVKNATYEFGYAAGEALYNGVTATKDVFSNIWLPIADGPYAR
jgi:archaellin